MPSCFRARLLAIGLVALLSPSANAKAAYCDLSLPRFTPDQATPDTAPPWMTRIPRDILVEHAGFPTPDAAARCFGARYHDNRVAEFITFIVAVDDGWGYLTPGKSARKAERVTVGDLHRAARKTGHALRAIAHTHPYGTRHFSAFDVAAVLSSDGTMYMTNWRNETYRTDGAGVRTYMKQRGYGLSRMGVERFLREINEVGFVGERVR